MADTIDLGIEFRAAMRRLATTVAIITTGGGGEPSGMAATAVMSVTADPPTIVVAVNRAASLSPAMAREPQFCVNLLGQRHRDLVSVFSGKEKGAARFAHGKWQQNDGGPPILTDALASLMCETAHTIEIATHTLFVGAVRSVINHPTIDPLVWVDGGFADAAQ